MASVRSVFFSAALGMMTVLTTRAAGQATAAQPLPRDVRREVVSRWNAPDVRGIRAADRLELDEGRDVVGDVSVLRGPLIIGGHVTGRVLAINSDVALRATARVDGDILIVGGQLERAQGARVGGGIRIYRQSLDFREDGDRIVVADETDGEEESWWRRLEHVRDDDRSEALRIVSAGAYNRVEGLPIELGPLVRHSTPWGSLRLNAAAVVRTGTSFSSEKSDVGQRLGAESRFGRDHGIGVGASAYNVVDAIERWQLSDLETSLAAFAARRDYRDYFNRHGAKGYVTAFGGHDLNFIAEYGVERWSSRGAHNPFSLLDGEKPWRENPSVDEGLFHVAAASLSFDTRTDPIDPWSGWFANADLEHGNGHPTSMAPRSGGASTAVPSGVEYTRAFVDVRRYNRLGPDGQLNMRVVLGGRVGGDPLPIERKLSVDGPGALPGFDFRSGRSGPDVGTCDAAPALASRPAECDRIALAQLEYRGDLGLDLFGNWEDWPHRYHGAHGDAAWVFFADAGRGWKVGTPDGMLTYRSGTFPRLDTFRADLGLGVDVGGLGLYAAKSVSTPAEPLNYFVRLRHRF